MTKTVTLIYASGYHEEIKVPASNTSVVFPADKTLYPPQDTSAPIEQFVHEGKIYWFARESQQAISQDRVTCVFLGIE